MRKPSHNRRTKPFRVIIVGVLSFLIPIAQLGAAEEEMVTIPKSRLVELEKKEAQLELLLKGQKAPRRTAAGPAVNVTSSTVVVPRSSRIVNGAAVGEHEVIEATDLVADYTVAKEAAEKRYGNRKLVVRGRIEGFDKQAFRRNYSVLLKADQSGKRVICDFLPASDVGAVFTTDSGSRLVASARGGRVELARTGEVVEIRGRCKGLRGSAILMEGWELRRALKIDGSS